MRWRIEIHFQKIPLTDVIEMYSEKKWFALQMMLRRNWNESPVSGCTLIVIQTIYLISTTYQHTIINVKKNWNDENSTFDYTKNCPVSIQKSHKFFNHFHWDHNEDWDGDEDGNAMKKMILWQKPSQQNLSISISTLASAPYFQHRHQYFSIGIQYFSIGIQYLSVSISILVMASVL